MHIKIIHGHADIIYLACIGDRNMQLYAKYQKTRVQKYIGKINLLVKRSDTYGGIFLPSLVR